MNQESENKTTDNQTPDMRATKYVTGIAGVLLVFIVGYGLGAALDPIDEVDETVQETTAETDHSHIDDEMASGPVNHIHKLYEVSEGETAPSISSLAVEKDAKSGWNVSFTTSDFTFTPENVNEKNVPNEGHAHIYVDGEKISRLYSNSYHLGELSEGEHEIKVTLNANDHSEYAVDGEVIDVVTTVTDTHHSN